MYTIEEILKVLHEEANIKSAYIVPEQQNIIFFTWADILSDKCPINQNCVSLDRIYPCSQCPIIPAVTATIKDLKSKVEKSEQGATISNVIDWFQEAKNETTHEYSYVFVAQHRVDLQTVSFFLVPIEIYKEGNQGILIEILNTYYRINQN